jgi:plasmid stabilization system protein ParE
LKIVWSPFALSDRDGIFTHIEADNPAAAIAIDERIGAAISRLRDFPKAAGPAGSQGHESSSSSARHTWQPIS